MKMATEARSFLECSFRDDFRLMEFFINSSTRQFRESNAYYLKDVDVLEVTGEKHNERYVNTTKLNFFPF